MLTAGDWQDIHQRHAPACEQCDDGRHSAIHLSCRQQIWSCPSDRLGHSAASNRRQQLHSTQSVSPSHDSSHTLVMSIRPAGSQCCLEQTSTTPLYTVSLTTVAVHCSCYLPNPHTHGLLETTQILLRIFKKSPSPHMMTEMMTLPRCPVAWEGVGGLPFP